jgi:hypothetical protein
VTEYDDLSPCTYFPIEEPHTLKAVGWLGPSRPFHTGDVSDAFLEKLCQLLAHNWLPSPFPGVHECELCRPGVQSSFIFGDHHLSSTSVANLFVPQDGVIYVAPEGIGHYILCHRYLPPPEFIEAVLNCPPARSMEYKRLLLACGGRVLLHLGGF